MARNRYPGTCACGTRVAEGAGYFEKIAGTRNGWRVRCMKCVASVKVEHNAPLSRAQQRFVDGRDLV